MKILIVLLLIGTAYAKIPDYIPKIYHELIETLRGICIPRIGITEDIVDNYVITDDSEKMKCYMRCMMTEGNWMTPNGDIAYDYIMEQIHPDIAHIAFPLLEKCRVIESGPHECDMAYNFNVCLYNGDSTYPSAPMIIVWLQVNAVLLIFPN